MAGVPVGDAAAVNGVSTLRLVSIAALCGFYIGVSSLLIRFNKYLMHESRFPYSMQLSSMHMAFSLFYCSLFYLVKPSSFPGMKSTEGKRTELLRWFVPIGLAFAVSLYASNTAYKYSNVAFLQFMKEGNVIISFLISCAAGLQVMNRVKLAIVFWIVACSALCVTNEVQFVLFGFVIQLVSQVAECCRVVLGELVLGGSGLKLDPMTYTMFAAPTCLAVLMVGNIFTWEAQIVPRAVELWYLLLPNASLAFVLNVTVAMIIKEASAVGFILTGVVKDIVLVTVSAMAFGEEVAPLQALGFILILGGIMFWSLIKVAPEHPIVRLVEDMMFMPREYHTKASV